MNAPSRKCLILLSASYPYGTGEPFLEKELPYLLERFSPLYLIPMFARGAPGKIDKRITLLSQPPLSDTKFHEFFRGLFLSKGLFFPEWKSSPGFPLSFSRLYLVSRTIGIAKRIERHILDTIENQSLDNGIIYSYWMNQASIGAVLAAKKKNWKVVTRVHGGDLYTGRHPRSYLPWHQWKVQNMDRIFTISNHGKEWLCSKYPSHSYKIKLHRLGVPDSPPLIHTPGENDTLHIASCSSVISLKRVDLILKTVGELKKRRGNKKIRYTHIGTGPGLKTLKEEARKIKAPGLEISFEGYMPNESLSDFYKKEKVDLFINYSTTEGLPVSIMEAFRSGIPVVAPAVGGIPEIVDDSNGILFPPDIPPVKVAERIEKALVSKSLRRMGVAGRNKWKSEYNDRLNFSKFAEELAMLSDPIG